MLVIGCISGNVIVKINLNKHSRTGIQNKGKHMSVKSKKIITIDCGKNSAYYYDHDQKKSIPVTHQELLELPHKMKNVIFVAESAHLDRPRTMKSFAQPFTVEQLNYFKQGCKDNGNILKLFPEMLSYDVISASNYEKSDETDPIALYEYISNSPDVLNTLKNPSESYDPNELRKEGWAIKSNMNTLLNYARRNDYGKDDPNDVIRNWLTENINDIVNGISEQTKVVFELDGVYKKDNIKKNIKKGDININEANMTAIYSIAAVLFEFNISKDMTTLSYVPRLRKMTNALPGWKFVARYVFGFSPWHLKGGLARSNLKFHNFKTYLNKRCIAENYNMTGKKLNGKQKHQFNLLEKQFFKQVQNDHKKSCKDLFLSLKRVMEKTLM